MGVREKLNRNPWVTGTTVAVVAVLAVWYAVSAVPRTAPQGIQTRAFFTSDDGKTWFTDSVTKAPPQKTADGKEAVQAILLSCQGGKNPFVLYVWRYNTDAKAKLDEAARSEDPEKFNQVLASVSMAKELKKPGQANWTPMTDFRNASQITALVCPPGQDDPLIIEP